MVKRAPSIYMNEERGAYHERKQVTSPQQRVNIRDTYLLAAVQKQAIAQLHDIGLVHCSDFVATVLKGGQDKKKVKIIFNSMLLFFEEALLREQQNQRQTWRCAGTLSAR